MAATQPASPAAPGGAQGGVVVHEARLTAAMIATLRTRLGLTQTGFATRYRIPVTMLQRWEAAELFPDHYAMAYLRAIAREPEAV